MSHLDEGQLHSLLDGELEEPERQAAEAHLAACPECRLAYQEAKALLEGADQLIQAVEVPRTGRPGTATPLLARRPSRRRFNWRTVAWAASVVLAVGLGWLARADRGLPDTARSSSKAESAVDVTPGPRPIAEAPAEAPAAAPAAAHPGDSATADALAKTARPSREEARRTNRLAPGAAPATPPAEAEPANQPAQLELGRGVADAAPARSDLDQASEARDRNAQLVVTRPPALGAAAPAAAPAAAAIGKVLTGEADERKESLAPSAQKPVAVFQPSPMVAAVRILGGSIRLVDGLTPARVLVGPGSLVSGLDPRREVVRVVYMDPPGRELWLDQQRPGEPANERQPGGLASTALLPGDTLVAPIAGGARSLRWVDQTGFRLVLTGFLPADSLRALASRVQ
jgi:Putative zinc-finger